MWLAVATYIFRNGPPDSTPENRMNVMSALRVGPGSMAVVGGRVERSTPRLSVVVGFDGSESAYRALDAATQLISGRTGNLVVVYVAHLSSTAGFSPEGLGESLKAFDALKERFTEAIHNRLDGVEQRWILQRRDGAVADELVAAADQVSRDYGNDATVVIVVGGAKQTYHHVVGSVPVALVRHAKYPIVVVP
jgi:nucleotide-binding universal stress UspA family protein